MQTIQIKTADFGGGLYKKTLELRDEVLRKPLGLSLFDESLNEESDFHIAAVSGQNVFGCLILTKLSGTVFKMRQVAVKDGLRGQGIGAQMVLFSEALAQKSGCKKMVLNARLTAVDFYKKLNYECEGVEFTEVGIPHIKMFKDLERKANG